MTTTTLYRGLAGLVIVSAVSVLGLFGAGQASAAESDRRACVSKTEYQQVRQGNTQTRVHAIFDTKGKRIARATSGGYVSEVRNYNACGSPFSAVSVSYRQNPGGALRVAAKSFLWVG